MKRTDFQKAVLAAIRPLADVCSCRADGTVVLKRSYFYRHGASAEKMEMCVQAALAQMRVAATTTSEDRWRAWPATSFFVVIVSPTQTRADAAKPDRLCPHLTEGAAK
jgi:hypothetical protein